MAVQAIFDKLVISQRQLAVVVSTMVRIFDRKAILIMRQDSEATR